MRGNIHRRIEDLERRAPKPQEERSLIPPEVEAWLDEYAAHKATGTLAPEDEEFADALKINAPALRGRVRPVREYL